MEVQEWKIFGLLLGAQILLLSYFSEAILFWDTVQFAGKQATYYFENGFSQGWLVPSEWDSGHPPIFPLYIASVWVIFGKSLLIAHWAMFPIVAGIIFQSVKIGYHLLPKMPWLFPLLLFISPNYLGHSILVSPDLVLLLGMLLSLRGLMENKSLLLSLGVLLMCAMSNRGVAISMGIYLYELYVINWRGWGRVFKAGLNQSVPYLPGLLLFVLFTLFHYYQTGWIGYHNNSSWAPSFAFVELGQLTRNLLIFGWKIMDFGIIACGILLTYKFRFLFILKGRFIWLCLFLLFILGVLTVPYVGLLNNRYFLPVVVLLILISSQLLVAFNKKWLTSSIIVFILAGNFWIYPNHISQGWDSTAAHFPFYRLEGQMKDYIQNQRIKMEHVGTAFPIRTARKYLDVSDTNEGYKAYNLQLDSFVLYSNVMNEFSNSEIETLFTSWKMLKEDNSNGICMVLFGNPNKLR